MSLTDLVAYPEASETLEPGTVCITFDDGYLDSVSVAAPNLEHKRSVRPIARRGAALDGRVALDYAWCLSWCHEFFW